MTIKEDFEKAIQKELKPYSFGMDTTAIALWAAKWMAGKLCDHFASNNCDCRACGYVKELQ